MTPQMIQNSVPAASVDAVTPARKRPHRSTRQLIPRPGNGQVRLRMAAIGLSPLGVQAVGIIEAVGQEAVGFAPGDRVALRVPGSRPGFPRIVSERDLIGVPKDVPSDDAAGILPAGLVARTIVKQIHSVGRGNRVHITPDPSGVDRFVEAWAKYLGAVVVNDETQPRDIVVTTEDYRAAERWRYGHGLVQLAAVDVFSALRAGAFEDVHLDVRPLSEASRAHSDVEAKVVSGPVVLVPGGVQLAA